ncbi:hypothetical protein GCM10009765_77690 [Fodinicola feengrottensis]|uniref:Uncharacterized protein n=1 Tax=Fodinicola feengrottensis TaxID=435914 RepID=A0ABP4V510_9ACTN
METLGAIQRPGAFGKASPSGRITLIAVAMATISIWSIGGLFVVSLINRAIIHQSPWIGAIDIAVIATPHAGALLGVAVSEGGMSLAQRLNARPAGWYVVGWIIYGMGVLCAVAGISVSFVLP